MAKKRVFISDDYDNDKAAVDRLLGWDATSLPFFDVAWSKVRMRGR